MGPGSLLVAPGCFSAGLDVFVGMPDARSRSPQAVLLDFVFRGARRFVFFSVNTCERPMLKLALHTVR